MNSMSAQPKPLSDINPLLLSELCKLLDCNWYNALLMLRLVLPLDQSRKRTFDKAIAVVRPDVKEFKQFKTKEVIEGISLLLVREEYQKGLTNEQVGSLRFLLGICKI